MTENIKQHPVFLRGRLANMLAIANIPRAISKKRDFEAFLCSCAAMVALMALFGAGRLPQPALLEPPSELFAHGSTTPPRRRTLGIMLTIALIGVPLVLAYTISIYWIFRGKVQRENLVY